MVTVKHCFYTGICSWDKPKKTTGQGLSEPSTVYALYYPLYSSYTSGYVSKCVYIYIHKSALEKYRMCVCVYLYIYLCTRTARVLLFPAQPKGAQGCGAPMTLHGASNTTNHTRRWPPLLDVVGATTQPSRVGAAGKDFEPKPSVCINLRQTIYESLDC